MTPNDEAIFIAHKLRSLADEFRSESEKWKRSIETKFTSFNEDNYLEDEAGRLVIRAFNLELLPDFGGLTEVIKQAENPPPESKRPEVIELDNGRSLVPRKGMSVGQTVFAKLCGYNEPIFHPDEEVGFEWHGGLIPNAMPSTFPPMPAFRSRLSTSPAFGRDGYWGVFMCSLFVHYSLVCKWLAEKLQESRPASPPALIVGNTEVVVGKTELARRISVENQTVIIDNKPHPLLGRAATKERLEAFISALIEADGLPVSAISYNVRTRDVEKQCEEIKALIWNDAATGKGYVISRDKLWPS